MLDVVDRVDRRVAGALSRWSIPALRIALGVVFVWFGALKVFRVSPVAGLVARTAIVLPRVVFRGGNPLLLTVEGEFIVKNLVLLAAGLVVGATVRGRRPRVRVAGAAEES